MVDKIKEYKDKKCENLGCEYGNDVDDKDSGEQERMFALTIRESQAVVCKYCYERLLYQIYCECICPNEPCNHNRLSY